MGVGPTLKAVSSGTSILKIHETVGINHHKCGVTKQSLPSGIGESFCTISYMNLKFQVCSMTGRVQVSRHWQELLLFATELSSSLVRRVFQF